MAAAHRQSLEAFRAKEEAELANQIEKLRLQLKNETEELQRMDATGRNELIAAYEAQIRILQQEIVALENRPVQVIHHYH